MTVLELGGVLGRVGLDTTAFDRAYAACLGKMANFGKEAQRVAAGTVSLDEALAAAGDSATKAAAGFDRASKAASTNAKAQTDAAAASERGAKASAQVAAALSAVSTADAKVQAATLRVVAAQERLTELQAGGSATTRQLASANAALITSQRSLAKAQADSAITTSKWRSGLVDTLKTAGQLGLIFGGFEAVKQAIDIGKEAADYQKSMTRIRTLTGASADEIKTMSSALLDMAGQVAQSPDALATSLYHMESIGLSGAKALNAVKVAAQGAKVGNADLEDTTNALTSTIASGIIKNQSYAGAMSDLLTIVGSGDMTLQQFNESLSSGVLATLAGYGLSLHDVGAALALFGDNNIRGAHAATTLRMAVQGMVSPVKTGAATLANLGLTTSSLADDMAKGGLKAAVGDLSARIKAAGYTAKETGQVLTDAFGKRAGTGINILVREFDTGTTTLLKKYDDLDHASMTFGQRVKETMNTAAAQFDRVGTEVQAAGIKIAGALLPFARPLASGVATGLEDVLRTLEVLWPEIKVVGAAWLGMWGGQLAARGAIALITAVQSGMETLALKAMYAEDAVVGFWTGQTAAADAAAASAVTDAGVVAGAAEGASTSVVASGEAAEAGWVGIAGPIGAAAVGLIALISVFHKSASASKEATDAAKAYADALQSGDRSSVVDAITKQLVNSDVPQKITALNKALGSTQYSGKQFVDAINAGGPALDQLRSRLQATIDKQSKFAEEMSNAELIGGQQHSYLGNGPKFDQKAADAAQVAGEKASQLLADLNAQYGALSRTVVKDLQDTKAFAGASSSIDQVGQSLGYSAKSAEAYAGMLGVVGDKNSVVDKSAAAVKTAILSVASAYRTATGSGMEFLSALQTFSTSAGTASDRAALIAATLKAANGDALNFAAQMNASAGASKQFATDVKQAAAAVGKSGESTRAFLASVVNLKTGTIDFNKAAAGPLISDLQSMQTAAMNAAQAMYQHARATESGKQAADDAYKVYKAQTSGALVDEARKLGLTKTQAKALADQYFGMPKRVKTLIEQEGANPIVTVLNQIGRQLSYLTGHKWKINTDAQTQAAQTKLGRLLTTMHQIGQGVNAQVLITTHNETAGTSHTVKANAKGTNSLGDGYFTVGEQGYELGYKRGSNVQIFDHAKSVALTGLENVPGYAKGTAGADRIPLGHAMGGTKVSALLGDGGLGTEWITKLSLAGKQLVATFLGITASLQRVRGSSSSAVAHALAGAVAPDPTTAQGWQARLAASQKLATADREQYEIAKQNLQALNQRAAAADRAAKKAQADAEAMKSSTKAQKSAKGAAEAQAKALQTQADALGKLASRAKSDFDKIKSASAAATQKMQSDAQSLVAALQADEQAVAQNFQNFSSGIAQGLTAGSDLATMFGGLTSNVDSAKQALDAAQAALQQATPDTSKLAAAQAAQAQATAAQAAAHAQLTKALAGGDAAAILAAQQAQTTAAANLADAQAAVTAATPTADQLAAQAQAQQQLTAAQQAYAEATKAATASGAAGAAAQFAASESKFSGDLTTLANKLGKGPAAQQLITQIAGLGATMGDSLAQGLINDPKSRKSLLASMSAISAIANTEGDALAQGFYGAGIKSIEKLIEGIEKKTPSLTKALAPILAQLAGLGGGTSYTVKKGDTLASILNAEYGASKNHPQLAAFLAANPELAKVGHTASLNKFAGTSLSIPSFAKGVTDWPGGLAYVHGGEVLVNMPRGSNDVIPANHAKGSPFAGADLTPVVTEIRALRGQVSTLADDMGQVQARVGAGLYVTAGSAHADKQRRAYRKGAL